MSPDPALAPAGSKAKSAGAGGWVKTHPGQAAALLGGSIGALVLLRVRAAAKPGAAVSGPPGSQGGPAMPGLAYNSSTGSVAPGYLMAPTADTSATDAISSVQPELDAVERQIQAVIQARQKLAQIPPGAPTTTNPPVVGAGLPNTPGTVHIV